MSALPDVLVLGGGAIGLATAWRCAQRGARVDLVDPAPARAASLVAAGMLAPVTEAHYGEEALLRLNLAGAAAWEDFAAELAEAAGRCPGYQRCGTVAVARDRDDLEAILAVTAYQKELGLEVERLTSRELRRLEPALAPTVRGGTLVAGDHQVDNRALVAALRSATARTGVQLRAAAATRASGCRARLDDGTELAAGRVVVAAGAWSGAIELDGGWRLPVRPVKGQILRLRSGVDGPPVSRVVRGRECYVAARPHGEVVVGATQEERGFDTTVTAGPVHDLLRAALELVPGVAELELAEPAAGLRPGTPDNAPVIGALGDGPVVATGHHRHGILLTPVTAGAAAAIALGDPAPSLVTPFSPQRFPEAGR